MSAHYNDNSYCVRFETSSRKNFAVTNFILCSFKAQNFSLIVPSIKTGDIKKKIIYFFYFKSFEYS